MNLLVKRFRDPFVRGILIGLASLICVTCTAHKEDISSIRKAPTLPPRWTDTPAPSTPTATDKPTLTPSATLTATATEPIAPTVSEIDGMEMVYVPEGKFWMGDDYDRHQIHLDAFWIDRTEVTNAMFANFLNAEGNQMSGARMKWLNTEGDGALIEKSGGVWRPLSGYENHPVVNVNWYGAQAYCAWAGRRLPTEAEWEKAARGNDSREYPWGNEFESSLANFNDDTTTCSAAGCDGFERTSPVGSFPGGESPYGALDLMGNVSEWIWDWHGCNYYFESPAENPPGPNTGYRRVIRGGSWNDNPQYMKNSISLDLLPDMSAIDIGFRCGFSSSTSIPSERMFELTSIHMASETEGWGINKTIVMITRDGGQTWLDVTPSESLTGGKPIEVYGDFIDADHAWLLFSTELRNPLLNTSCMKSNASVIYTVNGGQTWKASSPLMHELSQFPCAATVRMVDTRTGWLRILGWYTGAGGHVPTQYFHTTDGGATWKMLVPSWCGSSGDSCYAQSTPEWLDPSGIDFVKEQTGWILRETLDPYVPFAPVYHVTTDGGLTWRSLSFPAPLDAPDLFSEFEECEPYQLNLLTEETVRLKVTCRKKFKRGPDPIAYIYASDDAGYTWNAYPLPLSTADNDEYYQRMIFIDADFGLFLGQEMFQTYDGGATWQQINTVDWEGVFSFVDRSRGWAIAMEGGSISLMTTASGGADWQILNPVVVP